MAQACAACGGVGYGSLDPEFGYRKGGPCPVCSASFEEVIKTGKKNAPKLTFGPPNVGVRGVPNKSIAVVDGDSHAEDSEAWDPGVVDTGGSDGTPPSSRPISIDEALSQAGAEAS